MPSTYQSFPPETDYYGFGSEMELIANSMVDDCVTRMVVAPTVVCEDTVPLVWAIA
jgi:hypothetical protein